MKIGKKIITYLFILAIAFLMALSYELFVFPNNFAPSGLGGVCTMIQYILGVRVSMLNLLMNIPLAIAVYVKVSKPAAIRAMVYTLGFSLALMFLEHFPVLQNLAYFTENGTSTILGPITAGIISGSCGSVLIRAGSCSGGMDFAAALIRQKFPEFNFFIITFILNATIAITSYFVYDFQIEPVLLCIIYSYLASSVSDRILKAGKSAVKFEIVTKDPEKLSQELIAQLHHSVTLIDGQGMYTGEGVSVLMCVINRSQIYVLEEIVEHYPGTFAYLSSVKEVVGRFKSINKKGEEEHSILDRGSQDNPLV